MNASTSGVHSACSRRSFTVPANLRQAPAPSGAFRRRVRSRVLAVHKDELDAFWHNTADEKAATRPSKQHVHANGSRKVAVLASRDLEEQLDAAVAHFVPAEWSSGGDDSDLAAASESAGAIWDHEPAGARDTDEDFFSQRESSWGRNGRAAEARSEARADVRALEAISALSATNGASKAALQSAEPPQTSAESSDSLLDGHVVEAAEDERESELLPALELPAVVPEHRLHYSASASTALEQLLATKKFRERWQLFIDQLQSWNYGTDTKQLSAKRTSMEFARANPDLLHALPVRDIHIFVKKFAPFSGRLLDRKVRAASRRLHNLYCDFHLEATFNGDPQFQDLLRLLRFVQTSDFPFIEAGSPGIVSSASELLPLILTAAVQPPTADARLEHSAEWQTLRDDNLERSEQQRRRKQSAARHRHRPPSSEADEEESRLESLEAKLASKLRAGKEMSRPWTPWDDIAASEATSKPDVRRAKSRSRPDGNGASGGRPDSNGARRAPPTKRATETREQNNALLDFMKLASADKPKDSQAERRKAPHRPGRSGGRGYGGSKSDIFSL